MLAALFVSLLATNIEGWFELQKTAHPTDPITVHGWAVSRCGTPEVVLRVDDRELARAKPWLEWPGVRERFPGVASAERPGFHTVIDPLHYKPGEHRVSIVASSPECQAVHTIGELRFTSEAPPPAWLSVLAIVLALAGFGAIAWLLLRWGLRYHPVPLWWMIPALLILSAGAIVGAPGGETLFDPLANWDGGWYVLIAREGYSANAAYAFLPLFPLLVKLLSFLPVPLELATSVTNAALFAGSIRILQKLMPGNESGLLAYAALPFSFFFVAVYTESLALFLSVAMLFALRERKPAFAFLCGFLAGLTRVTSLALILFAVDEIRNRRPKAALAALGPAAGIAAWMTYLWITTGDPLRFVRAQEHFGRATSFSPGRLVQILKRTVRSDDRWDDVALVAIALVLLGAAALIVSRRIGEGLYAAALISLPLATLTLTSLHRYALLAFPVFPVLAGALLRNRVVYYLVIAVEIYFLFILARHFGQEHWVG